MYTLAMNFLRPQLGWNGRARVSPSLPTNNNGSLHVDWFTLPRLAGGRNGPSIALGERWLALSHPKPSPDDSMYLL